MKYLLATLENITPIPSGSIYRGDGVFDMVVDIDPAGIKKKLAEFDKDLKVVFKDNDVKVKSRAEGAPVKDPKAKL